jgi:hypothetical protein
MVQSLSAALPAGYVLVLKDHPRSSGIHPPSFYRAMTDLENVVVLDPTFSNHKILDKCQMVVTIAGTLGFQQLMRGKPIIMFGRKYYEELEGVIRIDDMNKLPYRLKSILAGTDLPDEEAMRRSLNAFIFALLNNKYEVDANVKTLHHKPHTLADLIDRMIDREVKPLVDQKRNEGVVDHV